MIDPHDRLLAKAFGDLDTRPFAWCFDEPSSDNPLNRALEPMTLSDDEARELDNLLEHPTALPTLPLHGVPHRERERETLAAAPQEPREGVTYYMTGDNFLAHLRRSLGMPEE